MTVKVSNTPFARVCEYCDFRTSHIANLKENPHLKPALCRMTFEYFIRQREPIELDLVKELVDLWFQEK